MLLWKHMGLGRGGCPAVGSGGLEQSMGMRPACSSLSSQAFRCSWEELLARLNKIFLIRIKLCGVSTAVMSYCAAASAVGWPFSQR